MKTIIHINTKAIIGARTLINIWVIKIFISVVCALLSMMVWAISVNSRQYPDLLQHVEYGSQIPSSEISKIMNTLLNYSSDYQMINDLWQSSENWLLDVGPYNKEKLTIVGKSFMHADGSKLGGIIIVHGKGEFKEKYRELIFDFYNLGYDVHIYDQRGHGESGNLIPSDVNVVGRYTHVDLFTDYSDDLEKVITHIKKIFSYKSDSLSLFLWSHSMGGAVVLDCLQRSKCLAVKGAVLHAPMIEIKIPLEPVVRVLSGVLAYVSPYSLAASQNKFNLDDFTKDQIDNIKKTGHPLISSFSNRFYVFHLYSVLTENMAYIGGATNNWIYESFQVTKRIRARGKNFVTPIKLLVAEKDSLIRSEGILNFCNVGDDSCNTLLLNEHRHEDWNGLDMQRDTIIMQTNSFFHNSSPHVANKKASNDFYK